MKHRKLICGILLFLIVLLTGIEVLYYNYKIDLFNNDNTEENVTGYVTMISNNKDFQKIIKKDKEAMLVLGKTGCEYCKMYLPVLESVSKNYDVDIYYVDLALFSEEDYGALMDTELKIPAKCTKDNKEVLIKKGFGTPLTLFTKKSEVYDCIRGYKTQEALEKILVGNKYIDLK